jgi:hypothetical protein
MVGAGEAGSQRFPSPAASARAVHDPVHAAQPAALDRAVAHAQAMLAGPAA